MNLPKNWDEISIGQYIELRPFIEMEATTTMELIDKTVAQLTVLTGQTKAEVEQIRACDIKGIQESLAWLYELPLVHVPERFRVGDKWFRPTLYREDMSAGQFMAVTELLKDSQDNPELTWQQLHYVLVNVCIETDEKGVDIKIESEAKWIKETAELFYKSFPFSAAYPIAVFFCELSKKLPAIIQDSLIAKAEKTIKEVETDLRNDGAGL